MHQEVATITVKLKGLVYYCTLRIRVALTRRGNFKKPAMWIGGAVSGSAQGMRRKDWAIDAVAQTEVYPLKIHVMPLRYGTCTADLPQKKIPRSTGDQGKCTRESFSRPNGGIFGLLKADRTNWVHLKRSSFS
jgi:hypothetical protein